jgi:hypothetical protein
MATSEANDPLEPETVSECSLHSAHGTSRKLARGCGRETAGVERADLEAEEDGFHWQTALRRCHSNICRIIPGYLLASRSHHHRDNEWKLIYSIN